jgi:hypothetical protein
MRMKKSRNVTIRRQFLRWVMNATLVLSVFSFSGHVSQPKSFSNEPTRTELRQTKWTAYERTVRFANTHDASSHSFFDQSKNFVSSLFQCERQIEIKLKGNSGRCTTHDKQFLLHFFTYNSEESGPAPARG